MTPRRCVLLDRDGVINVDRPGSVRSLGDFLPIPGSVEAIANLSRAGLAVVIVTNQACVGRGDVPMEVVSGSHRRLSDLVAAAGGRIDHILVATACNDDHPDRKPNPGLVHRARELIGFDPAATWLVGDDGRDVEAALAGGVRPALVLTGKGQAARRLHPSVPVFTDLAAFAAELLAGHLP